VSVFKRGNVYWYKFMWNGEMIRESTKQGNDKKARNIESAHRTALANGLVGIREKKPAPVLADFLKKDFLQFVESSQARDCRVLRRRRTDGLQVRLRSSSLGPNQRPARPTVRGKVRGSVSVPNQLRAS
jgi:hypothetical protein